VQLKRKKKPSKRKEKRVLKRRREKKKRNEKRDEGEEATSPISRSQHQPKESECLSLSLFDKGKVEVSVLSDLPSSLSPTRFV
jgi:hypothetical protein